MSSYVRIAVSAAVALVLSLAATPVVKSFANHIGAIDFPKDSRRVHQTPIPRLGGLAIFIGFLLSVILFVDITTQIRGILFGAVLIVVIGAIDDVKPLHAIVKLIFQILAALVAIYHGVIIEAFSNPFVFSPDQYLPLGFFSIPVTVIWIVAITNSVNLIDGLDGLAVGVSAISSIVMLVIAVMVSEPNIAVIMAALAGGCIGFMPYNLNPAKIFMGDTGALLLGYVLATVSIPGLFKLYALVSFAAPFLVLALPLFDTSFAFLRRLIKRQNPLSPDRGHFHHRLIDMGLSQKQAVAILYTISGLLGLVAVVITTSVKMKALILAIAAAVAAFIVFFAFKGVRKPAARNGTGNIGGEPESDGQAEAAIPAKQESDDQLGTTTQEKPDEKPKQVNENEKL